MPAPTLALALLLLQAGSPRQYECLRTSEPISVDGRLTDAAWKKAAWTDDFVDIEGAVKPKPRFRTRAKLLWDDRYLYIAAELEEPDVWGTLTVHDSVIFQDNDFEVFLNPSGDSKNYFEFEMNSLNTGWDLFLPKPYRQQGKADNGWEIPGLKTAVQIQGTLNRPGDKDTGWTLEIAFPWTAFKQRSGFGRPKVGDEWRVNFSRVEWRTAVRDGKHYDKLPGKEDNWVWSPQGVVDMHRPETWGILKFGSKNQSAAP
jgi:hypothetical protein